MFPNAISGMESTTPQNIPTIKPIDSPIPAELIQDKYRFIFLPDKFKVRRYCENNFSWYVKEHGILDNLLFQERDLNFAKLWHLLDLSKALIKYSTSKWNK